MNDCEISLSKFLSRYLGFKGKNLTKVTHDEVKKMLPNVRRCSFEDVRLNKYLLETGRIVMVSDGKTTIPYYTPMVSDEEFEYLELDRKENKKRRVNDRYYDYTSLTVYQLKCLLEKKFNSSRNIASARKELENRGIVLRKKYKRNEFKNKMEELK